MKILKKELVKYKDMYKYSCNIIDRLLCYSLHLIKNNFKDNIDLVKYVDDIKLECNLLVCSISTLWIQQKDILDCFFDGKKERKLLSDKAIFNTIKALYEEFKKAAMK